METPFIRILNINTWVSVKRTTRNVSYLLKTQHLGQHKLNYRGFVSYEPSIEHGASSSPGHQLLCDGGTLVVERGRIVTGSNTC